MDIVLEIIDTYVGDHIYARLLPARIPPYDYPYSAPGNASAAAYSTWTYKPATAYFSLEPSEAAYLSAWPRDNIWRQAISLYMITWIFGVLLYFVFGTLSYYFVFDHSTMKHPKFLKNQIALEMKQANTSMPLMSLLTMPLFLAEVRGWTKLYDTSAEGPGLWYDILQYPLFLFFTDCLIYFIHRGLHHPLIYKHLHKPHHKWIVPTPFASHAFHPVDGFAQSVPYHVYPFLFPLQKAGYVGLFIFVNFWTILIHDGEVMMSNPVVNGAACHMAHHLYFNYNYGQYFTLWDRLGGSYREPSKEWLHRESRNDEQTWRENAKEMEKIVVEVEGVDDRSYEPDGKSAKKNQ